MRVNGSPRVESIPLILLYAASSDLSGNISTIVCCNFKSQSVNNLSSNYIPSLEAKQQES